MIVDVERIGIGWNKFSLNITNNSPLVWYSMILYVNISNNSPLVSCSMIFYVNIRINFPLVWYSMILDVECIEIG